MMHSPGLQNIEHYGLKAVEYGLIYSFSLEDNYDVEDNSFTFRILDGELSKQYLSVEQTQYYLFGLVAGYEKACGLVDSWG